MNKVAGIVRTHLTDRWSWVGLPWIILFSSFGCNLIIGGLSGDELRTGGLASIYVYMFVLGIISLGQTFPFLIGLSIRRKDYFLGTTFTIGIISIGYSILLLLLGLIERETGAWGVQLYFFQISYISEGSLFAEFWIMYNLMINVFFCGFVISSIHRKYGRNGIYLFFIVMSVVTAFGVYMISEFGKWEAIFDWIADISVVELSNGLFVLSLIYIAISYLLLRKSSV